MSAPVIHPKVGWTATVTSILTIGSVLATALAGSGTVPWLVTYAGLAATLIGALTGYLAPATPKVNLRVPVGMLPPIVPPVVATVVAPVPPAVDPAVNNPPPTV